MELYRLVAKNVQEIINQHDPVGLVAGGAPDDEYDTEIGEIIAILRTETEKNSLADKINSIFKEAFGNEIEQNKDLYLIIADELLNLKKRLKW